jgi:hypothetical protein
MNWLSTVKVSIYDSQFMKLQAFYSYKREKTFSTFVNVFRKFKFEKIMLYINKKKQNSVKIHLANLQHEKHACIIRSRTFKT